MYRCRGRSRQFAERGDGRDVDDRAAVMGGEAREQGQHQLHKGRNVDIDHCRCRSVAGFDDRRKGGRAGIVHQHGDPGIAADPVRHAR